MAGRKQPHGTMSNEQQARITQIKAAMRDGAPMNINGVDGRWNATGDVWTADELSRSSTLILVRISDAEEEEINGVARQIEDTCKLTAQRGARVGMILVENDTSAFKRRKIKLPNGEYQLRTVRPKFRLALRLLGEGRFRRFVAYHLDRAVRDPRDLEDLIDVVEGSRPRIIVDSFTGSLRLANDADITAARILCAVANQASRDTVRRVSRARKEQAEEGRFGGGRRAFGFEPDGITKRPQEADAIRRFHAIALVTGNMAEIARDMNSAGIFTVNGKPWTGAQARDMLLRPRNAGLTVHRPVNPDLFYIGQEHDDQDDDEPGREEKAGHPQFYTPNDVVGRLPGDPIIDPEDYWALVAKVTDPDRQTNRVGNTPCSLGAGIYRCPCGDVLRSQTKKWTRRDENREITRIDETKIYRCMSRGKGHILTAREELDALVGATICELIRISDPADIIGQAATGVDVPALHAELARHEDRLRQISADYDDDVITRSQMLTATAKRRKKITEVKAKLAQVIQDAHPAAKLVGVEDIEAAWDALTLGEQRAICRRLVNVTVKPVGRGKRVPVRDRISITKRMPSAA
jgi:DNA invertase Pin-like site-specific DNA recombinase